MKKFVLLIVVSFGVVLPVAFAVAMIVNQP